MFIPGFFIWFVLKIVLSLCNKSETMDNGKRLNEKYHNLLREAIGVIKELVGDQKIDFEDNGFEDEANNDLCAVDNEYVYFEGGSERYELFALGILDAIEVINVLENQKSAI